MERWLILLLRLGAGICLAGAASAIVGAVQVFVEWQEGPGFGTGPLFAGGLVLAGAGLGLFPGLTLWRASTALRKAGQSLPVATGRRRGASSILTALVVVGWLVVAAQLLFAPRVNLVMVGVSLAVGLVGATAAWSARFVAEAGLGRALLYVAGISAALAGVLIWAYG